MKQNTLYIKVTVCDDDNMQDIINRLTPLVSKHVGDEHLKKIYAISMLSMGIDGVEEPLHIHVHGDRESGKTDLQTRFLDIVPDANKDIASDFSPRVLMYANLNPSTIISMNDKIFTDSMCTLLNQIADSTSWRMGRTIAVTVGKERVNLVFPPRTIFWMNSNKAISEYSIKEVDPDAVESRFMTFKKKYTDEQKKNIFVNRNLSCELNENEINDVKNILINIFKNPKSISCSDELRIVIWNKSKEMGINSMRQIGRNLTISQVYALINERNTVSISDIESAFLLLREQLDLQIENSITIEDNLIENIKKNLLSKEIFSTLSPDKKLLYTCKEIQKNQKTNITSAINVAKSNGLIGYEVIPYGAMRTPTEVYFVLGRGK